jgi:hypothetical protein
MDSSKRERLLEEVQELKERLRHREAALPAHSVRPYQLQEIEEIEERIADLEKLLAETNQ